MPPTFYWKPTWTTCRNARSFLEQHGIDVEERDINRNPPDRAFLEKHVDEKDFLDYVSKRSPVFKTRPLPTSKKETIDLMMEQPNLIRRPILVRGSKAVFGFDKESYRWRLAVVVCVTNPEEQGNKETEQIFGTVKRCPWFSVALVLCYRQQSGSHFADWRGVALQGGRDPYRHIRLELSDRSGDLERSLLPGGR
jgi:arsenate reductase